MKQSDYQVGYTGMKKFSKELLTGTETSVEGYWKNMLWDNFFNSGIPASTIKEIIAYLSDPKNIIEDFSDIEVQNFLVSPKILQ